MTDLSFGEVCVYYLYLPYLRELNIAYFSSLIQGHFECPPYNPATIRSIYHVRNIEVYKLKQVCKKYITADLKNVKVTLYQNVF